MTEPTREEIRKTVAAVVSKISADLSEYDPELVAAIMLYESIGKTFDLFDDIPSTMAAILECTAAVAETRGASVLFEHSPRPRSH